MADEQILRRLETSAGRIAELIAETSAERERRAALIAEAHEAGLPWKRIARAARMSTSSVHEIWAAS